MTPEQALIELMAKANHAAVNKELDPPAWEEIADESAFVRDEYRAGARAVLRTLAEAGCTEGMVEAGSLCTQGDSIAPRACAVCCFQRMLSALLADEEKPG